MKRAQILILFLVLLIHVTANGQSRETARADVVDKIVATVNGGLITYTDLLWQLALQPDTPLDNPRSEGLQRALEIVIDQRLIAQEGDRLPSITPKNEEVEAALAELIRRFPSRDEFQQRVSLVGLTAEQLREIVRERVEIEKYLDFRFRSFTLVTTQEAEDYYREVYVPRFRGRSPGRIVPKLEEVHTEIEKTLTESKIESATGAFIDEARLRAEIVILNPV